MKLRAEQLAPCGYSLQNESFNHMVNTRAPKGRHYAGTRSNMIRVSAAVSCKNRGANYIEDVFKDANMTPSASEYRRELQEKRQKKAEYQKNLEVKKRRLFLKFKSSWKESSSEKHTGLTYVSGMGSVMERAAAASSVTSWIPPPPVLQPDCELVIFDIETTGLLHNDQIIQVAAKCGDAQFSVYIVPTKHVHPKAETETGFRLEAGKLYRYNTCLPTKPPQEACKEFINFLRRCSHQTILVGHNIGTFDFPRLLRFAQQHKLAKELCGLLYGITDTQPLIKQGKMRKQALLAATYLKGPQWERLVKEAHDALVDCVLLNGLLEHFEVSEDRIKESCKTITNVLERQAVLKKKTANMPNLDPLADHGVSKLMRGRMAENGVTLEQLAEEYKLHQRKGLEVCLGVQLNGKPRVTTSKKIIDKIEAYFKNR